MKRPLDGVGGAERPGLRRAMMKRIGQHEQPGQRLIVLAGELAAHALHGGGRGEIDVDDHAGEIAGRMIGQIENGNRFHAARIPQNARELFALVLTIRCEQQTSRRLRKFCQSGHVRPLRGVR